MEESNKIIRDIAEQEYKYGFITDIDTEAIPRGLDEEVVRLISRKKEEPEHKELFAFYEQSLF